MSPKPALSAQVLIFLALSGLLVLTLGVAAVVVYQVMNPSPLPTVAPTIAAFPTTPPALSPTTAPQTIPAATTAPAVQSAPPAPPGIPDLAAASDTGVSNTDNITNDSTPRFVGSCAEGEAITLISSLDGVLNPAGVPCTGGFYDITLTTPLSEGTHAIAAVAQNTAGEVSPASLSLSVVIDTTPPPPPGVPDLDAASDTGASNSDNVTSDTTPRFTGFCTAGNQIILSSSVNGDLAPSMACDVNFYDITIVTPLSQATHIISARAVDVAGNVSPLASTTVVIESAAPAAPGVPDLAAGSDTGISDSDNITHSTTPRFTGTCASGDTISLFSSVNGDLSPAVVCTDGRYDITLSNALSEATHAISARAANAAGNVSVSLSLSVTVDTTPPPAPGTPDMAAGSDTGVSNSDNITSDDTPQFTGSCAEGTFITLVSSLDGALTPAGVVCSGGAYDITLTSALRRGTHTITAIAEDVAGNDSPASGGLLIDIESDLPTTPGTPQLHASSDSGVSNSDRITRVTSPRFTGTCASGDKITLRSSVDGTLSPTGVVCTGDAYDITLTSTLSEGTHNITATATDAAGQTSPASAALSLTIDTAAPPAPGIPDLAASSDTGASNSDNITHDTTPQFTGTCETGATVTLSSSVDGALAPSVVCSGGVYDITLTSALSENAHQITAVQVDAAGNSSATSGALSVNVVVPTLAVTLTGNVGVDRVFTTGGTPSPGPIDCPSTRCDVDFALDDSVTLNVAVDADSTFQGWGGDCASFGANLTGVLVMNGDKTCTATFISPEMDVEGNAVSIADGDATPDAADHTDFGDVLTGTTLDRTFTIQNEGTDTLTLTDFPNAVALSGAAEFTVVTQPASATIAPSGSLTFVVRCAPTGAGALAATVSIANDDPDENPYDFALSCNGTIAPEIDVQRPATNSLADGATDDLGNQSTGTVNLQYTLDNSTGSDQLSVSAVTAQNLSNVSNFVVNTSLPLDIPAGKTATLEISFNVDAAGAFSLDMAIANNDSDEDPYDIRIIGTGATLPEMNVLGNDKIIFSGDTTPDAADHTDFGSVDVDGATVTRTFTIKNVGTADLTLSGTPIVTIGGAHAADFTLTVDATTPVAAGGETTFTLTFDPSDTGLRQATISIANNDGDENPYTFAVQGTGTGPAPEMDVLGNGISIPSGDASPRTADNTDFGTVTVGNSQTLTFTIANTGSVDLNLSGTPIVTISGTHAADFTLAADATTPVASSGTTTFQITFTPSAAGPRQATISIANDDSDENPYTFAIQGTGQ